MRAALDLLRSDVPVHGLAHITGDGLCNLLRLTGDRAGFSVEAPLPSQPIFELIARHGNVSVADMWEVFNMGCGFVAVVPPEREEDAIALLSERQPGTARIGGDGRRRHHRGSVARDRGRPRLAPQRLTHPPTADGRTIGAVKLPCQTRHRVGERARHGELDTKGPAPGPRDAAVEHGQ